jgi:hypothetical protein
MLRNNIPPFSQILMANLQEIISRAEQLASGVAIDAFQSAVVDAGFTFETLFPHVLRFTVMQMVRRGEVQELARIVTINVMDGVGDFPETAIKECLDDATVLSHPIVARVPYSDFVRSRFDAQMAYFAVLGDKFYFANGAEPFTDDVDISIPSIPVLPEAIEEDVEMTSKTTEEVIFTLAAAMRGEIPLNRLITE